MKPRGVGAEIGGTMMRKYVFLVLFLCASCISQSYQLTTSFDSLFPMTWYQKGLEASLSVWQKLIHCAENNIDPQLSNNELLGLLTRTLFYIDRMKQESVVCMAEDKDYFVQVMN